MNPSREDVVADGAALEHLAVDNLGGLGQVAEDHTAVSCVARVNFVKDIQNLKRTIYRLLS